MNAVENMHVDELFSELRKLLNKHIYDGSVKSIKKSDLERCLHVMGFYPTPQDLNFLHSHFDTDSKYRYRFMWVQTRH